MVELLCMFADMFSAGVKDLGYTSLAQHHIDRGDHNPIKQLHRRIALARRIKMEETVGGLIKQGVVGRSNSSWASLIELAREKDEITRCCVDYRSFIDITVKDSNLIPSMNDTLDALVGLSGSQRSI